MPREYPPQYVQPGQTLKVGDKNGNAIEIIGVNHPAVLAFVRACKDWIELTHMPVQVADATMGHAREKVNRTFSELPASLFRELDRQDIDLQIGGL